MADAFTPVPELDLLKEFDTGSVYLGSMGVELLCNSRRGSPLEPDPLLGERLLYFAQANGSGSQYGFWRRDDREDLAAQPFATNASDTFFALWRSAPGAVSGTDPADLPVVAVGPNSEAGVGGHAASPAARPSALGGLDAQAVRGRTTRRHGDPRA